MNKQKRVCFLLNNDFVSDNRVRREAEALVQAGYDVTVFCVVSQNPQVFNKETKNGVKIHRIFPKRLYKFHAFSLKTAKAFLSVVMASPLFHIVHAHDANMLLLGYSLAKFWGSKLVYDAHEYWLALFEEEQARLEADTQLEPLQKNKKLKQLKQFINFETWALPRCQAVISVNETLCRFLQERARGLISHCVTIRNVSELTQLPPSNALRDAFNIPAPMPVLIYQGQIAEKRGLSSLVDAMNLIKNAALVMIGPVLPSDEPFYQTMLQKIQASPQLTNRVFFKAAVPAAELLSWTVSADLGVHPLLNIGLNHYYCLPNKIFEYVQAGIPVAVSHFPEMQAIVDQYGIGLTFDPSNPEDMAQKIRYYLENPGIQQQYQSNVTQAKRALCWENEEKILIHLYEQLLLLP